MTTPGITSEDLMNFMTSFRKAMEEKNYRDKWES